MAHLIAAAAAGGLLPSPIRFSLFSRNSSQIKSTKQTVTCCLLHQSFQRSIYCRCFFSWLVYYNEAGRLLNTKLVLVLRLLSERAGFVCCWLGPKISNNNNSNLSIKQFIQIHPSTFQNAASKSAAKR